VLAGQDSVHLTDEQASELLRFVGVSVNPEVAEGGVDCRIDVHVDELFGSVVSFGLTGDIPELLGDRAYATPPLTDIAAADLVRAPATAALLQGHAGAEPVDLRALESLLCSVAALADSISEISDLSVDVRAHAEGASVASAQVSVSSALNSSALYSSERRAM